MIDNTVFQDKTAVYYTLGCKLNFAETSTLGQLIAEQGIRKARPGEKADLCVINTCSVTELATRSAVRPYAALPASIPVPLLSLRVAMRS